MRQEHRVRRGRGVWGARMVEFEAFVRVVLGLGVHHGLTQRLKEVEGSATQFLTQPQPCVRGAVP